MEAILGGTVGQQSAALSMSGKSGSVERPRTVGVPVRELHRVGAGRKAGAPQPGGGAQGMEKAPEANGGERVIIDDLKLSIGLLIFVLAGGALAYHFLEGWEFVDSLYFSSATVTTVGYGDITPKTFYGKVFTVIYMWSGVPIGFFVVYSLMKYRRSTVDRRVHEIMGRVARGRADRK